MALGLGTILGGAGLICTAAAGFANMKEKKEKEEAERKERRAREEEYFDGLDDRIDQKIESGFERYKRSREEE